MVLKVRVGAWDGTIELNNVELQSQLLSNHSSPPPIHKEYNGSSNVKTMPRYFETEEVNGDANLNHGDLYNEDARGRGDFGTPSSPSTTSVPTPSTKFEDKNTADIKHDDSVKDMGSFPSIEPFLLVAGKVSRFFFLSFTIAESLPFFLFFQSNDK